eukprot:710708-Rhodomonas_salina.1
MVGKGSDLEETRRVADEGNTREWVAEWVATASQPGTDSGSLESCGGEMPADGVRRLSNCSDTSQEGPVSYTHLTLPTICSV